MNHTLAIQKLKSIINNYTIGNISFRNLAKCDVFPLYKATENELFNKHLAWGTKNETELTIEVKRLLNEVQSNKAVVISVCEKYTGTWAGLIKFMPYQDGLELTLWIHPNFWNSKLSLRAGAMAVQIAFDYTDTKIIYCRIKKENLAVKRIVEAAGFKFMENIDVMHEDGTLLYCERLDLISEEFRLRANIIQY
jgi:RimJ/RimL family protein N-acetyltransferase